MKKLFNLKNIIFIMSIFIIILSLVVFIFYKKTTKIKTFDNDSYKFIYDDNWKITSSDKEKIILKNKKDGTLKINIITLDKENRYLSIEELIDNVIYDIENQNKEYKLISKKDSKVTEKKFNGYKYLYENNNSEVMMVVTKYSDKVLIFTFEATNKNFDILLDSVENIIYHFAFKSDKYTLSNQISIDTNKITYSDNTDLNKKIDKLDTYKIANNHCLVNYSIPNILENTDLATDSGYYYYKDNTGNIRLSVNVYNLNIYKYLDKDASTTIYSNYKSLTDDSDNYQNVSMILSEISKDDFKGYLYQVKYTKVSKDFISDKETKTDYEIYHMAFVLDKNHILIMELKGENINIPQKLVDNIKINSFKHYSSNIERVIEDNSFKMEMKQYEDYSTKKVNTIMITVPEKYRELDLGYNMYQYRFLGLNHDDNNNSYQYKVNYNFIISSSDDDIIRRINSLYSVYENNENYEAIHYQKDITLNGKTFNLYEGGYTTNDTLYGSKNQYDIFHVNVKTLVYKLESKGALVITVFGNNSEIDEEILNEISHFEIKNE